MFYAPGDILEGVAAAHRTRWTHNDELLALILETLDELTNLTRRAWFKTSGAPKPPFRYPRPKQPRHRRPATAAEMYQFFRGG